jgi:lysophospholipid acyltransferase (LPLAT)-like uncharacterized protein
MKNFLQLRLAPLLLAGYIKLLRSSMRLKFVRKEFMDDLIKAKKPFIFTFWHNRLIMMTYGYHGNGVKVLISMHRDGLMTSKTLKYFGVGSIQGSSTRGGAQGLRGVIRSAREGMDLGFTPDGPKGPACKVKPGVIQAARLARIPILPVSFGCKRKHVLKSWDRMQIPKLFTRGVFVYGKPFEVKRDLGKNELEKYSVELEEELNELSKEADNYYN